MNQTAASSNVSAHVVDWCIARLKEVGPEKVCPDWVRDDPLADLTVIIPTLNRPEFVLRQVCYWAPSAAQIMFVDGSSQPIPRRVRTAIDGLRRITYIHDEQPFGERLAVAASGISTSYAVMLGDDEFHLPSGLRSLIRVLEEEPDLVGCMGQVLSFTPLDNFRRCLFSRAYGDLQDFVVDQEQPVDRLVAAMNPYRMATCYAVLRSSVWRRSWGSVGSFTSGVAAEMQQSMAVHLLGPFRAVSVLQWLRSVENEITPISNAEAEQNRMIWFPEWWTDPLFIAERARFVDGLVTAVAEEIGMTAQDCADQIVLGAEVFVDGVGEEFEDLASSAGTTDEALCGAIERARSLGRRIPDPLALTLRRIRGAVQARLGLQGGNYYGTAADLQARLSTEGVDPGPDLLDEIALVERLVRDFHQVRSPQGVGRAKSGVNST